MKEKIAHIVSNVFNAYITLLSANFLIMFVDSENIPNWQTILVLIGVLMILQVYLFKKFNLISDLEISNRKQRPLFNLAASLPFFLMIIIATTTSSQIFLSLTLINFFINLILGIVSILWKISGHTTYVSFFATVLVLLFPSWYLLLLMVVLVVVVAWARVVLKRHTVAQTIAGSILGLIVPLILL